MSLFTPPLPSAAIRQDSKKEDPMSVHTTLLLGADVVRLYRTLNAAGISLARLRPRLD